MKKGGHPSGTAAFHVSLRTAPYMKASGMEAFFSAT